MFFSGPGFFRLFLAAAVVVSHLSNLEIGRPAVFAFFALSGFWVMRMYDEKYAASGDAGDLDHSVAVRVRLQDRAKFGPVGQKSFESDDIVRERTFVNFDPGLIVHRICG